MQTQANAIECALEGLFDYAGMFPPAQLDLKSALSAYREYSRNERSWALGSLVVRASDLPILRTEAQDELRNLRLTVLSTGSDLDMLHTYLDDGLAIETIEIKLETGSEVAPLKKRLP